MARIYLITLYLCGACRPQRRLFRKTFGLSAKVNKENIKTALKAGLYAGSATLFGRIGRRRQGKFYEGYAELLREAMKELRAEGYAYDWKLDRWVI